MLKRTALIVSACPIDESADSHVGRHATITNPGARIASRRYISGGIRAATFVLLALCAASASAAQLLCANSVSSLQIALSTAEILQQPTTIRIAGGTYAVPGISHTFRAPTTLEGGYNGDCSARATPVNADDTIIDAGGWNVVITQQTGLSGSQLSIDGITFLHANYFRINAGTFDDGANIRISRSHIGSNVSSSAPSSVNLWGGGTIELENVLIDRMASQMPANDCTFELILVSGGSILLKHVTADVAANKRFCMQDGVNTNGVADIYNSIFWSSVQTSSIDNIYGLDTINIVNTTDMAVHRNGAGGQSIGEQHADPQWANPANGDFHLTSTSPAVNSATPVVPGGLSVSDIEGNSRWRGALPDQGAYESPFESSAIYVVTTTADSGAGSGSLRDMITQANTSGPNLGTIRFNIPGACPRVIALNSPLPKVTTPILIDGTTQPGSLANTDDDAFLATLCVVVKPTSGTLNYAFDVPAGADDASLGLRGIAMGGFAQPVMLLGGGGHVIAGNRFGGFVSGAGTLLGATSNSISIGDTLTGSVRIGGASPSDRNLISGSAFSGINIQNGFASSPAACQIVNNLIGTSASGNVAAPNFTGIRVGGTGCSIDSNRIVGNTSDGILIDGGHQTLIQRNVIGVTVDGQGLANSGIGVRFSSYTSDVVIGAPLSSYAWGFKNTIRYMAEGGIVLPGGLHNTIRSNEIHDNGVDGEGFDIDLGGNGPSANDPGDADINNANFGQNFPVASHLAIPAGTPANATNVNATLTAQLDSSPGNYRIDAYFSDRCDGGTATIPGRGHADVYLGGTSADNLQVFTMAVTLPNVLPGGFISLTATDHDGNTSEMGSCYPVGAAPGDVLFANGFE